MFRNLKTLGLTLVAAFALSAMAASAASAETALIKGGPTVLGHDIGNPELTGSAGVSCENATYPGTVNESTISLNLEFSRCTAGAAPAVVTDNGCKYEITLDNLVTPNHADVKTVSLICEPGKFVDIHIPDPSTVACTIEIPAQANLPNDLTVTDEENGHLRIHGTVEEIENYLDADQAHEKPCVPFTLQAADAVLHVDMTLTDELSLTTKE